MSKNVICRICLRVENITIIQEIDEILVDFHDEITEYAIYENSAYKYCSICEHLLRKFYNFRLKCRKANKILKEHKLKKKVGFPSNLYELLPPKSLAFCIPSSLRLFNLNNGVLEPLDQLGSIKKEVDYTENELHYSLATGNHDNVPENDSQKVVQSNNYGIETLDLGLFDTSENDSKNNLGIEENLRDTKYQDSPKTEIKIPEDVDCSESTTIFFYENSPDILIKEEFEEEPHEIPECNFNEDSSVPNEILESNFNEDSSVPNKIPETNFNEDSSVPNEIPESNFNEDLSDTDVNEFKNLDNVITSKKRVLKRRSLSVEMADQKQPVKDLKKFEKVFDIQLFPTIQDAKDELALRMTTEPYISAEHKCEICFTVYKYAKQLQFHMRWHDPSKGDYECEICYMRFTSMKSNRKHIYSSHFGKFKCKKCPMTSYHRGAMDAHYQKHAGTIFTCKRCNRTFKHPSTYKTHLRVSHGNEHICVTCARAFVSEKGLIAHRNLIHKTKLKVDTDADANVNARCDPCGITFANEQVYFKHIKNYEKHRDLAMTLIACKQCGLRFDRREDLKMHKSSQHPSTVQNPSTIQNPVKTLDKDSKKCSICGLEGTSRLWILRHASAAHPDSPYVTEMARRKKHMCETCGKCYVTIYNLRDHKNTHTGVRPYACNLCPSRFTSKINLTLHQEWHAPAKRVCKECGKKFVSASNLSNHMRMHTQDRRYKCSICNKGFIHMSSLREHVRGVHFNVRRVRKQVKHEASTNTNESSVT